MVMKQQLDMFNSAVIAYFSGNGEVLSEVPSFYHKYLDNIKISITHDISDDYLWPFIYYILAPEFHSFLILILMVLFIVKKMEKFAYQQSQFSM